MTSDHPQDPIHRRIKSVDAFRGLVMCRMILGVPLLAAFYKLPSSATRDFLIPWFSHADWHGLTPVDFSFAAYAIIIGISISLSLRRRVGDGKPSPTLYSQIARRTLLLFLLGVIYNEAFSTNWPNIRVAGVLQRLAICYFIGAMIYLHMKPFGRGVLLATILFTYWGMLALIPVPNYGLGDYSFAGNLAAYVDELWLPGVAYYGTWDPEGILSTIPAVGSTIIGILMGEWLLSDLTPRGDKALGLLGVGCAAMVLGLIWDEWFPINKSLWTSSYVMVTAGIACFLLGCLYQVVDVWQMQTWAFPFIVVGRNLLLSFFLVRLFTSGSISRRLIGSNVGQFFGMAEPFVIALMQSLLMWCVLYWLYRRKILIKL